MRKFSSSSNILTLIRDHHQLLKDSISVLKEEKGPTTQKRKKLTQFLEVLKMHIPAEEKTLYKKMKALEGMRFRFLASVHEHRITDRLVKELDSLKGEEKWSDEIAAKAMVLAEIVEQHLKEEEKEALPRMRLKVSRWELEQLGADYLTLCNEYLEESIAEHRPASSSHHTMF